MRKLILSIVAAAVAFPVVAGGLMTNTNQSAAFLRSIARGTTLDPDAVHHNPAGTVFMADGWHFGISNQMAYQTRSTTSSLLIGNNLPGGFTDTEFKGEVFSPLIPSFHLTWKKNRWAVMVGMGVNGGGGKIKYDNGLASFERIVSSFPTLLTSEGLSTTQYSRNLWLEGSSQTLAFNIGVAFRITDWLSVAAQLRMGVTSNSYKAQLSDMKINPVHPQLNPGNGMISAADVLTAINKPTYAGMVNQKLNVDQKGTSWSPIIALAFHKGAWDATVKYEFKMGTTLENDTTNDINLGSGGMFPDGAKTYAQTPALLAIAASRQCGPVKVTAEWHHFFDKDAKNSFTENKLYDKEDPKSPQYFKNCTVKGNTNEYLVGAEWQICKKLLVSAGVQRTQYNLEEQYYSDMNFSTSSWSTGLGVAYNFTEKIRLNLGFMKTFYEDVTNKGIHSFSGQNLGTFTDIYSRTSTSWSIGLDFFFGKKK
ncbi:MAG: TonB-dependent receptor [Rikenellaceae bacterium]|nr:TonB-dependent receptor [Rikenellaceae bacterium]